ncbi:RNA polymerase sigma factor [Streptomyces chartreusis]|uniref:RNA polymerase sigma factor n=1 Tax=Streptomyces chartreusis TaxID=1969 RepID=UPI0035DC7D68
MRDEKAERRLHQYLAKRGVSPQEGEDIVQYALMKLWEKWPTRTPMAFAYHAAYDRWIDLLRSKHRDTTLFDPTSDWGTEPEDPSSDPATLATQKQHVTSLVNTLPDSQRSVFACVMDGMSSRQIAKELHLTEATVRSHLRHGRQRLRSLLQAEHRELNRCSYRQREL